MHTPLNKENRRQLVQESRDIQNRSGEVTVWGSIPEADQDALRFQILLFDGRKMQAPLAEQHCRIILDAFNGYRDGARVLLQGISKFDPEQHLNEFESVEVVTPLDPLDIVTRLEELRQLPNGWLDGLGRSLSPAGLDWLAKSFDQQYSDDLALPHLYPTAEGAIQAEWSLPPHEVSLKVDLNTHRADWHCLNLVTDLEETRSLALDDPTDWAWLSDSVRRMTGDLA